MSDRWMVWPETKISDQEPFADLMQIANGSKLVSRMTVPDLLGTFETFALVLCDLVEAVERLESRFPKAPAAEGEAK